MNIPETVTDRHARELYAFCNDVREAIKRAAALVDDGRQHPAAAANREAGANVTLCYRHLEDASMRLGKALQALDGGVSVYDRATTVGA